MLERKHSQNRHSNIGTFEACRRVLGGKHRSGGRLERSNGANRAVARSKCSKRVSGTVEHSDWVKADVVGYNGRTCRPLVRLTTQTDRSSFNSRRFQLRPNVDLL